jgi:hypothetical protein
MAGVEEEGDGGKDQAGSIPFALLFSDGGGDAGQGGLAVPCFLFRYSHGHRRRP